MFSGVSFTEDASVWTGTSPCSIFRSPFSGQFCQTLISSNEVSIKIYHIRSTFHVWIPPLVPKFSFTKPALEVVPRVTREVNFWCLLKIMKLVEPC